MILIYIMTLLSVYDSIMKIKDIIVRVWKADKKKKAKEPDDQPKKKPSFSRPPEVRPTVGPQFWTKVAPSAARKVSMINAMAGSRGLDQQGPIVLGRRGPVVEEFQRSGSVLVHDDGTVSTTLE